MITFRYPTNAVLQMKPRKLNPIGG
uniref:Uncharacterized protein n=1 Tax=Anguilla anguilla TaxID=7936 RepID=A0A0E9RKW8_ANGAN